MLVDAVGSVQAQTPRPAAVIVAVDNNRELCDRVKRELSDVTVVENSFARGVAGTRNTGVLHTTTPLVALLDDDALAHPGWLAELLAPFDDPEVIGTGGRSLPRWETGRPRWFPTELLWAVGASAESPVTADDGAGHDGGAATATAIVRNVWSLSMAVRRDVFEQVDGFQEHFTKIGDVSRPEDTDLCLRMTRACGGRWVEVARALVDHCVPQRRARMRYLLRRCYEEARGKVAIARRLRTYAELDVERRYLTRTVPKALVRGVSDAFVRRDGAGLARAAVVLLCLIAAGIGVVAETIRPHRDDAHEAVGGHTERLRFKAPVAGAPDLRPGNGLPLQPSRDARQRVP